MSVVRNPKRDGARVAERLAAQARVRAEQSQQAKQRKLDKLDAKRTAKAERVAALPTIVVEPATPIASPFTRLRKGPP